MALWITEHCRAWKETVVKYNQVPSLPWNHLLKVIMLSHKESCLPGRGSVSSVNHEMPILPPWARCGVDREFMEKFWLCLRTWLVQRKATSLLKREVPGWLTRQRRRDIGGSWSLLTMMMAEFCSARWKFLTLTAKPFICQYGRLCQKRFCTFWWQALEKRRMAPSSAAANCGFQ